MRYFYAILFSFTFSFGHSQITFSEEPQVRSIVQLYETTGKSEEHIEGWRIKLVSTTDYRKLDRVEYQFTQKNLDLSYSSEYENPYYSLKVGAFESRIALEPTLTLLKNDFREALPFRDKILKSELFE